MAGKKHGKVKRVRQHYPWVKCTNPLCGYEWEPKVAHPKQCPVCKRYLDWVKRPVPRSLEPVPRPFG